MLSNKNCIITHSCGGLLYFSFYIFFRCMPRLVLKVASFAFCKISHQGDFWGWHVEKCAKQGCACMHVSASTNRNKQGQFLNVIMIKKDMVMTSLPDWRQRVEPMSDSPYYFICPNNSKSTENIAGLFFKWLFFRIIMNFIIACGNICLENCDRKITSNTSPLHMWQKMDSNMHCEDWQ